MREGDKGYLPLHNEAFAKKKSKAVTDIRDCGS
jgi:hypothetical protein